PTLRHRPHRGGGGRYGPRPHRPSGGRLRKPRRGRCPRGKGAGRRGARPRTRGFRATRRLLGHAAGSRRPCAGNLLRAGDRPDGRGEICPEMSLAVGAPYRIADPPALTPGKCPATLTDIPLAWGLLF